MTTTGLPPPDDKPRGCYNCGGTESACKCPAEPERPDLDAWRAEAGAALTTPFLGYSEAARTGWPRDAARVGVLADHCEALQAALSEALDEFEDAIQYKLEYLVTKHGDRETLARLRALAAGGAPKGENR